MAANITRAYFLTLFGEFGAVAQDKIDAYLDIATIRVPSSVWGDRSGYATALLAAHMLATSGALPGQGGGAGGGPVTAEAVGQVSRSFGSVGEASSGDAELRTTRYGIDFIALRRETIIPGMITGPDTNPGMITTFY